MAWTVLSHLTAPTSNRFDWTGLSLASYKRVVLLLDGVEVGTDGAFLQLQLEVAAALETSGYRYRTRGLSSGGTDNDLSSSAAANINVIGGTTSNWGIGNAAGECGMAKLEITSLASGLGLYKLVLVDAVGIGPTGASIRYVGNGILEETGEVTGIRVLLSTGTMDAGTATLYGLTTS